MEITREIFDQQRRPRFGAANPERMQLPFWEWMIRGEDQSRTEDDETDIIMRDGKLKSPYGPYRARDLFNVPLVREDGPIWTFDRMGATRTELSDGRIVCIGGEHEDWYDPDFHIYNDVVVSLLPVARSKSTVTRRKFFLQRTFTQPLLSATQLSSSAASATQKIDDPAVRQSSH
jgi:hypothetical protein